MKLADRVNVSEFISHSSPCADAHMKQMPSNCDKNKYLKDICSHLYVYILWNPPESNRNRVHVVWHQWDVCKQSVCFHTSCSGESCSMSVWRHLRPGRKWLTITSSEMTAQDVKGHWKSVKWTMFIIKEHKDKWEVTHMWTGLYTHTFFKKERTDKSG